MEESGLVEPSDAGPLDMILKGPLLEEYAAMREENGGGVPCENFLTRATVGGRDTVGRVCGVSRAACSTEGVADRTQKRGFDVGVFWLRGRDLGLERWRE